MLANTKDQNKSVRENCLEILNNWPEIIDHLDESFYLEKKRYLNGFFIDNIFNDQVLNFSNIYENDIEEKRNKINKFIIDNKQTFSTDDEENNKILKSEINKLDKIYKKIIDNKETNLDKIINTQIRSNYKI